jgi:hypothetical protein
MAAQGRRLVLSPPMLAHPSALVQPRAAATDIDQRGLTLAACSTALIHQRCRTQVHEREHYEDKNQNPERLCCSSHLVRHSFSQAMPSWSRSRPLLYDIALRYSSVLRLKFVTFSPLVLSTA